MNMETEKQNPHFAEYVKTKRNQQANNGVFYINEIFTPDMMEYILHGIHSAQQDDNIKEIKIYINSNGGCVYSLLTLVDEIAKSNKPVRTIVLGKAFSAGAMLLLSGTEGKRQANKHSAILIHEVSSWIGYNTNTAIKDRSKWSDSLNKTLARIIKERTNMTKEDIAKYMESNRDIFITAKQALKYGIIDEII